MYDKDLMPVVDDLYMDGTIIKQLKQEKNGTIEQIFNPFINEIENEIAQSFTTSSKSKFKKEEESVIFPEGF